MIFAPLIPHWQNRVKYFKKLEGEGRQEGNVPAN